MIALCPSCDAEWVNPPGVVSHDDDCPWLAAMRADEEPCTAAATGFCGCSRHERQAS